MNPPLYPDTPSPILRHPRPKPRLVSLLLEPLSSGAPLAPGWLLTAQHLLEMMGEEPVRGSRRLDYYTTILPYYRTTILPYYLTTILPCNRTTVLLYGHTTVLPYFHTTVRTYYHTDVLQYYHIRIRDILPYYCYSYARRVWWATPPPCSRGRHLHTATVHLFYYHHTTIQRYSYDPVCTALCARRAWRATPPPCSRGTSTGSSRSSPRRTLPSESTVSLASLEPLA